MKKRGKVVRDTSAGAGLLVIDGQQFVFQLEGCWKSEMAPRINMVVDAEFDSAGLLIAVSDVPEAQLAREQAEIAMRLAKEQGTRLGKEMTARFGVDTLLAMAALLGGWFIFNTISVQVSAGYNVGFSFWKILGVLNSPSGVMNALSGGSVSAGIYGFFAIVALAGPLLPFFARDRRFLLGGLLPLLFMVVVCITVYLGLTDGMKQAQGAALAIGGRQAERMAAEMAASMAQEALRAISIGLGGYLSLIASLYFGARSAVKYLSSRA